MKGFSIFLIIALIIFAFTILFALSTLDVTLQTNAFAENVFPGTFAPGNFVFQDNLTVEGNLTGNFIHGNVWSHNHTTYVVELVTIQVYENLTNWTTMENNGFTLIQNTSLVTEVAGLYKVDYGVSFSGTANSEIGIAVGINGEDQNQTHAHRTVSAGGAVGNIGGTGIIRLDATDLVSLMARDEQVPVRDINVRAANMVLIRVGD